MALYPMVRKSIPLLASLAILGLVVWGGVTLLQALWTGFIQLNPTIAAGLVAAVTTVLVSVVSVLYAKHLEQKLTVRKEHREKKIPAYEDLISFIFRVFYSFKDGASSMSSEEMMEAHSRVTQRAIVWASDDVVKALHQFRVASFEADTNKLGMALAIEGLFLAIRKDLGHENKGLMAGQLLRLFINDLHKL